MQFQKNFSILRGILKAFGLSAEAIDDIVERVEDFLSGGEEKSFDKQEYPYHIRDHFLSPAEHSFFMVLKSAVADTALISSKVGLHDLFYVKSSDGSKYRIYTNKIDRKHVDFLLCDPKTVQPIAGIELDDKSHQRSDRQGSVNEPTTPAPTPTVIPDQGLKQLSCNFTVPKGKVASLMGVLNYLQSKYEHMDISLHLDRGQMTEQEYEDKVKEAFRQMGIDLDKSK